MFTPLRRRLLPLYVAKFLKCFVLWYAIEKVFMVTIGFNSQTIALMVAVYSGMSILMEIPSGIMADRWSRKGVLILASLSLALSGYIGWLSHDVTLFLISAIFWGFFDALSSGTDDAMIYDALIEEQNDGEEFEKEYGIYQAVGGVALIISGLASGWIGSFFGLREAFLVSVPIALLAIPFILMFREAKIHKSTGEVELMPHIRQTFSAVFRNPSLVWVLVTMFALGLVNGIIGEMHQIWFIALAAPTMFYGLVGAAVNGTWGFGGAIARFFKTRRMVIIGILLALVSAITLVSSRDIWILFAAQFLLMLCANAVFMVMMGRTHRSLPSHVRSGASSALNTVARLINIPLIMLFGWLAQGYSPFAASWMLIVLILIGLYSEFNTRLRLKSAA